MQARRCEAKPATKSHLLLDEALCAHKLVLEAHAAALAPAAGEAEGQDHAVTIKGVAARSLGLKVSWVRLASTALN